MCVFVRMRGGTSTEVTLCIRFLPKVRLFLVYPRERDPPSEHLIPCKHESGWNKMSGRTSRTSGVVAVLYRAGGHRDIPQQASSFFLRWQHTLAPES